jgi:hypothetical protein
MTGPRMQGLLAKPWADKAKTWPPHTWWVQAGKS